jgi:alpha-galactosidase/6-phospho-beta-glucosidase family protein
MYPKFSLPSKNISAYSTTVSDSLGRSKENKITIISSISSLTNGKEVMTEINSRNIGMIENIVKKLRLEAQ